MRTTDLRALVFLVPASLAIVACSSAEPTTKDRGADRSRTTRDNDDDDRTSSTENSVTDGPSRAETVTPPPVQQPPTTTPTPPPAPQVTNTNCRLLMDCARDKELDFGGQMVATMIAGMNKGSVCLAANVACQTGYLDFGELLGFLGNAKQDCQELATCCTAMQSGTTQTTCRQWAEGGSDDQCKARLGEYRTANQCQ